jgi:hypothetical protein
MDAAEAITRSTAVFTPLQRVLLLALFEKLPAFSSEWPPATQRKWWQAYESFSLLILEDAACSPTITSAEA